MNKLLLILIFRGILNINSPVLTQCTISGIDRSKNEHEYSNFYSPSIILDIPNTRYIIRHNELGPSKIISAIDGSIITMDLWFETNLLFIYYEPIKKQYILIGSGNENIGIIGIYNEFFKQVEKIEFIDNTFLSATIDDKNIFVGSHNKILIINRSTLKIDNKIKVDIDGVWTVCALKDKILCGGSAGNLFLVDGLSRIKLNFIERTESILGLIVLNNKFTVFGTKSINLVSENGDLENRINLDENYCNYFFYPNDSSKIVIASKLGILRFYETQSLKFICEHTIPNLNLSKIKINEGDSTNINETLKIIGPPVGNIVTRAKGESIVVSRNKYYYPLTGFELTNNEEISYCDMMGNFIMVDSSLNNKYFNNHENISAKGLFSFRAMGMVFIWYSVGAESLFYNETNKYMQVTYNGSDLRNVAIGYDEDYIYYTINYYDTTKNMISPIFRRILIHNTKKKYTFMLTDPEPLTLTEYISKFSCSKKDVLGMLSENNIFKIYDFEKKRLIFSIGNIVDFELVNKNWILLAEDGEILEVTGNRNTKSIGNSGLMPQQLRVSLNGKYLCLFDSSQFALMRFDELALIDSFRCPNNENLKYLEVTNSGRVIYATEYKAVDYEMPIKTSDLRINESDPRLISKITFDNEKQNLLVHFKNGTFEVFKFIK